MLEGETPRNHKQKGEGGELALFAVNSAFISKPSILWLMTSKRVKCQVATTNQKNRRNDKPPKSKKEGISGREIYVCISVMSSYDYLIDIKLHNKYKSHFYIIF